MVQALAADSNVQNRNMLIGPNLAGTWTPESVWDTGFATTYSSSLSALAVEQYVLPFYLISLPFYRVLMRLSGQLSDRQLRSNLWHWGTR